MSVSPPRTAPAPRHRGISLRVAACLIGAVLCFSSVPVFLRHFAGLLDAWTVNGFRYGVAALLWLPYAIRHRREAPPGRAVWRDALFPAAVNTLGQIGWALTPYYVEAGVMGFVIRASFLFTILAGFWLLPSERALARRWKFWAGAALTGAGLFAMWLAGGRRGNIPPAGWLVLLGTALFWGLYGVSVRRAMHGYPPRVAFSWICVYTAAPLAGLLALHGNWEQLASLAPAELALLAGSAVIGIAAAHVFLYTAIFALGPIVSDGALLASPFLTAVGAAAVLGESLPGGQWFGGTVIVAGSLLLILAHRERERPCGNGSSRPDACG